MSTTLLTSDNKSLLLEKIVVSMSEGLTQKDACSLHGMPVRTFQVSIQARPEIVERVLQIQREELKKRLTKTMELRLQAVDLILERAEEFLPSANIKTIFAFEAKLAKIQTELQGAIPAPKPEGEGGALAAAAAAYLNNLPSLKKSTPPGKLEGELIEGEVTEK